MINILIVTHGDFGKELIKSSELIIGKTECVESISFDQGKSFEQLTTEVEKAIEKFSDENLIVFTDMYGGSPYNVVTKLMKDKKFLHITGVNFPLFIDVAVSRETYSMEDISQKIIMNGKKSIVFVNEKFSTD